MRLSFSLALGLAVCLAMAGGGARAEDSTPEDGGVRRFTLDNGLQVLHRYNPASASVGVCLSVGVGSRHEEARHQGISHFVEHMAFAGTERYTKNELMETIVSRGGVRNGLTTEERTLYYAVISADHFDVAMEWLSQLGFHATLPAEEVEKERNVIFEEKGKDSWLGRKAQALGLSHNLPRQVRDAMFPHSSLAYPVIGEDRTLKRITRDDLLAYYKTHYVPSNAVLVVTGNASPEAVEAACHAHFAPVPAGTAPAPPPTPKMPEGPYEATLRYPTMTKQSTLLFGVRTVPEVDPDRWTLEVLSQVLRTSLMRQARYREGLAYHIGIENYHFSDAGYLTISTQAHRKNLPPIVELIVAEVGRIARGEVNDQELAEARTALCGRWALAMESTSNQVSWLERLARFYPQDQPLPDYRERISAVTAADLAQVARTYFASERVCLARHVPAF